MEVLRRLAAMPFLDRLELAAVSGLPDRSAYNTVAALERQGLAASLPHSTSLLRTTRRYYLTTAGLSRLADADGLGLEQLLRNRPVSARWRRILLERLDAVGVIYRLASSIASLQGAVRFRWYRGNPLDCGIILSEGRTIGVVRQGHTADRTGFAKRLWSLREGQLPSGVLLLIPDEVRLRHARRLLATAPIPALLSLERDVVGSGPSRPVWHPPSVNAVLGLREALSYFDRGGGLPDETPLKSTTPPRDIRMESEGRKLPDSLLPVMLAPAEKRALDLLSDWPWIISDELQALMGVSQARLSQITSALDGLQLLDRVSVSGSRLVLTGRWRCWPGETGPPWVPPGNAGAPFPATRENPWTGATSPAGAADSCSATSSTPPQSIGSLLLWPARPARRVGKSSNWTRRTAPPGTSATETGFVPFTPTPSAFCGITVSPGPSFSNGNDERSGPPRWRRDWRRICATTPHTGPPTIMAFNPLYWWSSTTTSLLATFCGSRGGRWKGPWWKYLC